MRLPEGAKIAELFLGRVVLKFAVIIPARYASTRFPAKALAPLTSAKGTRRPLIEWTWRSGISACGIESVIVATDSDEIAGTIAALGGRVAMTSEALNNGTERCAAVLADLAEKPGIVINLQGDNPLIPPDYIRLLLQAFEDEEVQVATPFVRCDEAMKQNLLEHCASGTAGGTCVVTNIKGDAAYFSKYPIPWGAGAADDIKLHVGLYAYRPEALEIYANLPPSELEIAESLEQRR